MPAPENIVAPVVTIACAEVACDLVEGVSMRSQPIYFLLSLALLAD